MQQTLGNMGVLFLPTRRIHHSGSGSIVSTTDLVSFWKLDEASGTRFDAFGSNDLTDNNTVGQGTGTVYANAADFENSNNEYLSSAHNSSLSPTGDMTVCCWVKFESFASQYNIAMLVTKDDYTGYPTSAPDREYTFYVQYSKVRFLRVYGTGSTDNVTVENSSTLTTGVWYFLCAYHDTTAQEIGISIDAGTAATASFTNTPQTGSGNFAIGDRFVSGGPERLYSVDGVLGPAMLFNRRLSDAEITALADASDPFYDQF